MSATGGSKAIIAAFLANTGIAITKFIAWLFSGSSSMLAESVHSVADAGNQLLLLLGGKRARRAASAEHPFGYGRERYVYAFVVSIILFSIGGLFSVYEGIDKLTHPHPLEVPWLPIVVLLIAIVLEIFSFRTAIIESLPHKGTGTWLQFIRRSKAPELPVVLLEDLAALLGLVLALLGVSLTILTGDSMWDGIGTVAIGVLLIVVAVALGIETKSLLVGEGASAQDLNRIRDVINAHPSVQSLIHIKTLYLGPDEMLVAAKIAFPRQAKLAEMARHINDVETTIRSAVPVARVIYLEPDVYLPPGAANPPTDSFVIKAAD
ncbi:cation diffusion facilitator family transporter [Lysobacter korlensis]|uniref:Cation diffusion facilitator family transporter n=1 Tax=Lysobacter korlensis TaxID=553636 RepID=A0ABV6RSR6_9GAMM